MKCIFSIILLTSINFGFSQLYNSNETIITKSNIHSPIETIGLDFDNDGDNDVFTFSEDNNYERKLYYFENLGGGVFSDAFEIVDPNIDGVKNIKIVDLNGDGLKDICLLHFDNSLNILFNNNFNVISPIISSVNYFSIGDVADFDEDGIEDIITTRVSNNKIIIEIYSYDYLNNNTTIIASMESTNTTNTSNIPLSKIIDIDNDGDNDILSKRNNQTIIMFENFGNNTFNGSVALTNINSLIDQENSYIQDINNDGFVDLIEIINESIYYYENSGSNNFNPAMIINTGAQEIINLTFSDLNNNNQIEIVSFQNESTSYYPKIAFYEFQPNNSTFNLISSSNFSNTSSNYPYPNNNYSQFDKSSSLIDIDGDNQLDLLVELDAYMIGWFKNTSGFIFENSCNIINSMTYDVYISKAFDFDNDGDNDIFSLTKKGYLFYNENLGNNLFSKEKYILKSNGMVYFDEMIFKDYNNDGLKDIFILSKTYNNLTIIENDNTNPFNYFYTLYNIDDFSLGDVNNNGFSDLLTLSNGSVSIRLNNNGYFVLPSTLINSSYQDFIVTGDADNDGDIDIFTIGMTNYNNLVTAYLHENLGSNTYNSHLIFNQYISQATPIIDLKIGDYDNNNLTDVSFITVDTVYILNNLGGGIFTDTTLSNNQVENLVNLFNKDVNNDGKLDIIVRSSGSGSLNYNNNFLHFYINNGSSFDFLETLPLADRTRKISFEDIDNNNFVDIIAAKQSGYVSYYTNIFCFSNVVETLNTCDSLVWIDGVTYYNSTNLPSVTLTNSLGCDSTISLNLTINYSQNLSVNDTICSGDSYTFPDGITQTNITSGFDYVSNLSSVITGCDSIVTTTINVTTIDNGIIQNGITLSANELNADTYALLECDSNYYIIGPQSIDVSLPGSYAFEITKNGCIDTTNCLTITNQDFYDLPYYFPLSAEVFAYPVSALDTCDGLALGFGNGGFPPYTFDWFTQTNNDYAEVIDSLCEGFHTLKIYDMLGDSAFIDYFVTDSLNWYDWYNNNATYVDTIYFVTENCVIDMNLPIDSVQVSDYYYLYSGSGFNEDYYFLEMTYYQTGNQYVYGDTVLMELNGVYLIDFSVFCPTKSSSHIKTIVNSFDFHSTLSTEVEKEELKINLFPNPTTGEITLNLGKENTNSKISIVDLTGKIIYEKHKVNNVIIEISFEEVATGIYFVKVESDNNQHIIKLIKE